MGNKAGRTQLTTSRIVSRDTSSSRTRCDSPRLGGGRGARELERAKFDAVVRAQHYLGREPLLERLEVLRTVIVEVARDFGIELDDQHFARGLGYRLALNPAQYLRRQRRHRFDDAPPVASRTRIGQQFLQALARALARHLDEPQFGNFERRGSRLVALERRRQRIADFLAIALAIHVDEIDDDDSADVAQPQLIYHFLYCFEVGLEDGVVLAALADEAAGIHVDCSQRFGLIENQVAARLEPDLAVQRALDLRFYIKPIEQRRGPVMKRHARPQPRHIVLHELYDPAVGRRIVAP